MAFIFWMCAWATPALAGPSSVAIIQNGSKTCPRFLDIFLNRQPPLIHRYQSDEFELYNTGETFIESNSHISHPEMVISEGAVIDTNKIKIGRNVVDSKKRKWFVTDVADRSGRVRLLDQNDQSHFFSIPFSSNMAYQKWALKLNSGKIISILIAESPAQSVSLIEKMLRETILSTPVGFFDYHDDFIFANAPHSGGIDTYGLFVKETRSIYFFPAGTTQTSLKNFKLTFWHEMGHAYWRHFYRQHELEDRWFSAIATDNNYISSYAKTNLEEDFCETIAFYILDDGGKHYPALRSRLKERYLILDDIFGQHPTLQKEMKKYLALRRTISGSLFILNAGIAVYLYEGLTDEE